MPNYTIECAECGKTEVVFRHLKQFGQWPRHCGQKMSQIVQAPNIMADIVPFQSVVTDVDSGRNPIIGSRPQLKDFERRNKCHQVGDDVKRTPKPFTPPPPVRNDLGKVVHEVLSRENKRGR